MNPKTRSYRRASTMLTFLAVFFGWNVLLPTGTSDTTATQVASRAFVALLMAGLVWALTGLAATRGGAQ